MTATTAPQSRLGPLAPWRSVLLVGLLFGGISLYAALVLSLIHI